MQVVDRENEQDKSREEQYLQILPSKVNHTIKSTETEKASGPDKIPMKL